MLLKINTFIFIFSIIIGIYVTIHTNYNLVNYKKIFIFSNPLPPSRGTTLESSFISFKSITLKGILKIIIFSMTFFYVKSFIYPFLIDHITNDLLKIHVICSMLTYLIGNVFNESLDYIVKDIDLNLFKNINKYDVNKDLNNNMETGESSKTEECSKQDRVITDSDYESDSYTKDPEHYSKDPNDYSDQHEDRESNVSKLINANLPEFKKVTETLTNDELVEVMETIDYAKEEYKRSNVPSAKAQIENLNIKENICASQLEENLEDKGKGKEVEETPKNKGKGKEIDDK